MKRITWINLLLGIWLLFAPFALGVAAMSAGPVVGNVVVGILLIATSWWILMATAPPAGVGWFQVLCGLWLLVAPFVVGFRVLPDATLNNVVIGIITIVVALVESRALVHLPRRTA